jgi:glycine C-acetyltransferase
LLVVFFFFRFFSFLKALSFSWQRKDWHSAMFGTCFALRFGKLQSVMAATLKDIEAAGLTKLERIITSPQSNRIRTTVSDKEVINFCANNYLGLANHPAVRQAAAAALETHGFGMSSVRFICGTQTIHKELEQTISSFLGTEDTILYPSAFDANAGIFEAILSDEDAVISDALNHASIIDGIRLCKAERHRYAHMNLVELEECLQKTQNKRIRLIVTDGVFSMDGDIAPLDKIVPLAEKYEAAIFVDESHSTGFMGPTGRGTPELFGVQKHIDIVNSTLGKALGGGSGGFSSGSKELVMLQRQRGRPYLFSNAVAPPVVAGSRCAFGLLSNASMLLDQLKKNTARFRREMKAAGFNVLGHDSCPICPVLLGDARITVDFANRMLGKGIYVIGFSFPVVPKGQARIRVQLSAAHSEEDVSKAIDAFTTTKKEVNL